MIRYSQCIILALLFLSYNSKAQFQITTPDTTVCPNSSVTLQATLGSSVFTPLTFPSLDDSYSPIQNIGFTFNYFGNNYTTCVVSQNGYICFNTSNASMGSPWTITTAIPGNMNVINSIMGFYADIYPGLTTSPGVVEATTIGVAPYRKYVVNFCYCSMYSCTTLKASFQMILCETTNEIEVHIGNAPNCPTWNSGAAIEGIQDNTGTIAYWVAGRNYPTQWTAFQSSHRFTPSGSSTYGITSIPYNPVPSPGSTINWFANGTTLVGSGTSVSVSPAVTTYYVAQTIKCGDTLRDTVHLTVGGGPTITNINPQPNNPAFPAPKANPTTCGSATGSWAIYGLDSNKLYAVHYKKNGVQQPVLSLTSTIYGFINLGNQFAGIYDSIYVVTTGGCFSNAIGPISLVDPPVIAAFTFKLHKGCIEDTVVFKNNSIQNTFNKWYFGDGKGDTAKNPTHIYAVQGVYNVKLVVTNGVCKDSVTHQVNTLHPIKAQFKVDDDSVCADQLITFTNQSAGTNATYFWNFGDSTTSTATNPTHTYPIPGYYTVMLAVKDDVPCYDTFYMPIVVDTIPYINFTMSDSNLCEGKGITFYGDYLHSGSTRIIWDFGDGNFFLNKEDILHAYDTAGNITINFIAQYRNCPDATFTKNVTIRPFPQINLGKDTTMCPNSSPLLLGDFINAGNPTASWLWNTGETSSSIFARHPGIYTTRVTLDGCENSDSIEVFKDCYLDIPNSFTPNGDGTNDYFLPRQLLSKGAKDFKMSVFNRWGQLIFQTTKLDGRGWDGKFNDVDQPNGVYVYTIEVTFKDDNTENYQGNVTLLR